VTAINSAPYTSALAQMTAIVTAAFIVWVVTYVFTKNRKMLSDIHDMKIALVGDERTALNADPRPGLIETVTKLIATFDRYNDEMGKRIKTDDALASRLIQVETRLENHESILSNLDGKVNEVLNATTALVADSRINGASASKDALVRIEKEQERVAEALERTVRP
jgi:hypothetical protein